MGGFVSGVVGEAVGRVTVGGFVSGVVVGGVGPAARIVTSAQFQNF